MTMQQGSWVQSQSHTTVGFPSHLTPLLASPPPALFGVGFYFQGGTVKMRFYATCLHFQCYTF